MIDNDNAVERTGACKFYKLKRATKKLVTSKLPRSASCDTIITLPGFMKAPMKWLMLSWQISLIWKHNILARYYENDHWKSLSHRQEKVAKKPIEMLRKPNRFNHQKKHHFKLFLCSSSIRENENFPRFNTNADIERYWEVEKWGKKHRDPKDPIHFQKIPRGAYYISLPNLKQTLVHMKVQPSQYNKKKNRWEEDWKSMASRRRKLNLNLI